MKPQQLWGKAVACVTATRGLPAKTARTDHFLSATMGVSIRICSHEPGVPDEMHGFSLLPFLSLALTKTNLGTTCTKETDTRNYPLGLLAPSMLVELTG